MKSVLLFLMLVVVGCNKPPDPPHVMYHCHKVWMNGASLEYQDTDGFTCAKVERYDNGYVYHAELVWASPWENTNEKTYFQDYNSLADAEHYAEQWCKP